MQLRLLATDYNKHVIILRQPKCPGATRSDPQSTALSVHQVQEGEPGRVFKRRGISRTAFLCACACVCVCGCA